MTKYTLDAHKTSIRIKDGRKVVHKVATTLTPAAIEGLIAGMDTETDDLDALKATLEAAILEAQARKASVVPQEYRYRYGADQNCGDAMAAKLTAKVTDPKTGVNIEACREIAAANGIEDRFDGWVSSGKNPGMVRMNLGNVLRGKLRRGEEVVL